MAVYGVIVTTIETRSETAQMQYDVGTALEAQVESAVAFIRDVARVTPHENMARDNEIADRNEKGLTTIVKVTYEVVE
jgi:hypothetical protein